LAISEFGPGSIIYHEGSRYTINKVLTAIEETGELASGKLKQCESCGYVHPVASGDGPDVCDMCQALLRPALTNMFRMRNVTTRRRERINSDEEERVRYGYEIKTGFRFNAGSGGTPGFQLAEIHSAEGVLLATLKYGPAATIWRINMGWARTDKSNSGFLLDLANGTWVRQGMKGVDELLDEVTPKRVQRVIPYVIDTKNCILVTPNRLSDPTEVFSLLSAIKQGIQLVYQLEDFELSAETLPDGKDPNSFLLFESTEGGAGVLRRLVEEPNALGLVARAALSLCHFNSDSGEDLKKATHAAEECVAACYDCLMNYSNQKIHSQLDRHSIKDYLLALKSSEVTYKNCDYSKEKHIKELKRKCDSQLERNWLDLVEKLKINLPSNAQYFIKNANTRTDFYYKNEKVAIYIDGPHHKNKNQQKLDEIQKDTLENLGITVIRFIKNEEWVNILQDSKYKFVFKR
jgi:very-short-patch-repair endonuclease